MLTPRSSLLSLFSVTLLGACSQAQFSGATGQNASERTAPSESALTCTVTPASVVKGGKVTVQVTGTLAPSLWRSWRAGSDVVNQVKLTKASSGSYAPEGAASDELTTDRVGSQTVELRVGEQQDVQGKAADATCDFAVTAPSGDAQASPSPTPPASPATPSTPASPAPATPPSAPATPPSAPATPATPATPPSTPASPCSPSQQSIGAQIAFLVDNSNSNAATDCAAATAAGQFNGVNLYRCGSATNREAAVLAAYDLLAQIATNEPSNPLAKSAVAIASFPTSQNYVTGWAQQTSGFVAVDAQGRATIENSMKFSRSPMGLTPFGAAFTAASQIFGSAANDARAKVAVLVTDGEPTDQDPGQVKAQADALKAAGVQVIVVTYNATHASRTADALRDLTNLESTSVNGGRGHWYGSRYSSFDAYVQALIGVDAKGQAVSTPTLAQAVSSSGQLVEATNAANLKATFTNLIRSQAVSCQN